MPDVISQLRAENDDLRARISDIERALLSAVSPLAKIAGLTGKEGLIVGMLSKRASMTAEAICTVLYSLSNEEEPDPKIVSVFVYHARRKLAPLGITIENVWGQGYRIPAESKDKLRKLCEAA